jgi:hypothetical protein
MVFPSIAPQALRSPARFRGGMATQYTRQTAVPCTLEEIKGGAWVQNDGLTPSGVRTPRGMIARASTIGVIIEKRGDAGLTLDDGTSIINVRSFDTNPVPVRADIGDIVLVVGRPREYNGERYLVLEICKKLRNPAWAQYRKHELAAGLPATQERGAPVAPIEVPAHSVTIQKDESGEDGSEVKNPFEALIGKIRELDSGSGADIEDVLAVLAVDGGDKYLRTLIEEGEIFETRPGKVKVLE